MARIQFDIADRPKIMQLYERWRREQPHEPNQIGSTTYLEVEESREIMHFPDAFVDALERARIPFKRL